MFNANHKASLQVTFQCVDQSLSRVVSLLDSSHARSPFSSRVPDATPVHQKVIADYASRIRAAMRKILESQGIPLPSPTQSSIWAASTDLLSAKIAIEELDAGHMRGYGTLTDDDCRALAAIVSQLTELLDKARAYLAQDPEAEVGTEAK